MDEGRRFRFLVPPFFFALSIGVGMYFSGVNFSVIRSYKPEVIIAVAALLGAAALPIGFLLTSLSILILRLISWRWGTYEVILSEAAWSNIWPKLRTELPQEKRWRLYAAATFDHELLSTPIHDWLYRRWTTFNLSAHCLAAVLLSHFAALAPSVHETWLWACYTLVLATIFGVNGAIAWRQTMNMLVFQSYR